jgi:hypothetical protein
MRSGISLALSLQRMDVNAGPDGARQGRQPGGAGRAEGASLDGRRLVRHRRFRAMMAWASGDVLSACPDLWVRLRTLRVEETKSMCRQKVERRRRVRAHIARAAENVVAPCPNQMCRQRLSPRPHQQTLFAFILLSSGRWSAPRRSCAILRQPPSDKNQDKQNASRFPADLAQSISRVFVDRRCSSCLLAGRGQNAGAAAVAPVVSNSGAGRSQADRSPSDVIMSGIVDSGR